VYNENHCSLRD